MRQNVTLKIRRLRKLLVAPVERTDVRPVTSVYPNMRPATQKSFEELPTKTALKKRT